jgi:hypothetical protein
MGVDPVRLLLVEDDQEFGISPILRYILVGFHWLIFSGLVVDNRGQWIWWHVYILCM